MSCGWAGGATPTPNVPQHLRLGTSDSARPPRSPVPSCGRQFLPLAGPSAAPQPASSGRRRLMAPVSASARDRPDPMPRWPPESASDLQAFCEASSSGRREGSPVYCANSPEFLDKKMALGLPDVDWRRCHIQVLFVDRTDTVRGRMAAGLLELVSAWNRIDMIIHQDRCGLDAEPGAELPLSTCVALLSRANPLGLANHHFIQSCQKFHADDLQHYDLIVAMDSDVESRLLSSAARLMASGRPEPSQYTALHRKVVLFSDFFGWCSNATVEHSGAGSLLPEPLVEQISPTLDHTRMAIDVIRPDLATPQGMDEWQDMTASLLLGCASITRYLIDAFPDDLAFSEDHLD